MDGLFTDDPTVPKAASSGRWYSEAEVREMWELYVMRVKWATRESAAYREYWRLIGTAAGFLFGCLMTLAADVPHRFSLHLAATVAFYAWSLTPLAIELWKEIRHRGGGSSGV